MYPDYQASLDGIKKQYEQLTQIAAQNPAFTDGTAAAQQVPTAAGIERAREYPLGKNCSVAIFDTEEDVFYFRKKDSTGLELPMKVGRYKLEDAPKAKTDFVTVQDFDTWKTEIVELLRAKAEAPKPPTTEVTE